MLDAQYLVQFEKETGIKLYINYYANNDELIVKLRETKGAGYDIIIPTDYAVELLVKEGLLQKIDKSKLNFLHTIKPRFLVNYFDQNNEYSIPYIWDVYGIGINKNFFKGNLPQPSWRLIFDEQVTPGNIGMINNAREVILVAANYLFGSIDGLTPDRIRKVKQLLLKQKSWVEIYSDLRADYLLRSGSCPVVACIGSDIWQAIRFDKTLDFLVPQEGTFMLIDNIAIPIKSKKQDLVYKFLNYLYKAEVTSHHYEKFALFFVTNNVAVRKEDQKVIDRILKEAKKIDFFRNVLSEKDLIQLWIELQAS